MSNTLRQWLPLGVSTGHSMAGASTDSNVQYPLHPHAMVHGITNALATQYAKCQYRTWPSTHVGRPRERTGAASASVFSHTLRCVSAVQNVTLAASSW
eukprot:2284709-Rhodomonas_salina.5